MGKVRIGCEGIRHFFKLTGKVIFNLGSGDDFLASVRGKIRCTAFAQHEMHRETILEHVHSVIMNEQLETIDDGFLAPCLLSRKRSLGGNASVPGMDGNADAADEGKNAQENA